MSRRSTRRWVRGGGALVLLLAAAAFTVAPAGADSPPGSYTGIATASGARVTFIVPGEFAVEEVLDAGGPLAQSRLAPGAADSFASFPYPGGMAVAYQGLLNIATGISSPFAYPFYVSAAQPGQPKQELTDPSGAYALQASAAPDGAHATARLRPGAPDALASGSEAGTSVVAEHDAVVATASSLAEGLSLGKGLLSVGSVASRSVTKVTGGRAPATETDLTVSGLRVGDKRIGVGPAGFEFLGTPVPLPAGDVEKLINSTLAPAGLQLRFVAPEPVAGGAQAAAIEIVSRQAPPNMPASVVTVRLGGAASAITQGEGGVELPNTGSLGPGSGPGDGGTGGSDAPPPAAASAPKARERASPAAEDSGAGGRPVVSASPSGGFRPAAGTGDGTVGTSPGVAATDAAPAPDQATATGAPTSAASTLEAAPVVAPRPVRSLALVYSVVAALGLSALVGAGVWAIRGGRWA